MSALTEASHTRSRHAERALYPDERCARSITWMWKFMTDLKFTCSSTWTATTDGVGGTPTTPSGIIIAKKFIS